MRAKKSLGQHFLNNAHTAEQIVAGLQFRELVIEVGPGKGILTDLLVPVCKRLVLVEKDDDLAAHLRAHYASTEHVTVVHGDILRQDLKAHTGGAQFALIGNFPYNISSQIVFKMLDYRAAVVEMVGMFQYEMAQRIVAGPGSKTYSVIGVLTQTAFAGKVLFRVGPGQFNPPPKVESAVIRLVRKDDLSLPCDYKVLRIVVKAAFAQRRKMLRNSLKGLVDPEHLVKDEVFKLRPEQISLETFYNLAQMAETYRLTQNRTT